MIGEKYNGLTVIGYAGKGNNNVNLWKCQCICGTLTIVRTTRLGETKSCGCFQTKHGLNQANSKIYRAWCAMKRRCYNKNSDSYSHYGGRGIVVCERWMKFKNFYTDMGDPPTPFHSIDRIDNNGNYEPSNCKWSTQSEQAYNRVR